MLRSLTIVLVTALFAGVAVATTFIPEAQVEEHVVYEPPEELLRFVALPQAESTVDAEEAPMSRVPLPLAPQELPTSVLHEVPFTPQAPFAQWSDPRYQDACEEVSVYMAMHWLKGDVRQTLDPATTTADLYNLSVLSEELFGTFYDTSAADTLWMLQHEVPGVDAEVVETANVGELKGLLASGAILLAPMSGQLLGNPHFSQPGPPHHMVVVIGYDDAKQAFIAHDPGTRFGAAFHYGYETFLYAMRDYHTGRELPVQTVEKRVIAIWRDALLPGSPELGG